MYWGSVILNKEKRQKSVPLMDIISKCKIHKPENLTLYIKLHLFTVKIKNFASTI